MRPAKRRFSVFLHLVWSKVVAQGTETRKVKFPDKDIELWNGARTFRLDTCPLNTSVPVPVPLIFQKHAWQMSNQKIVKIQEPDPMMWVDKTSGQALSKRRWTALTIELNPRAIYRCGYALAFLKSLAGRNPSPGLVNHRYHRCRSHSTAVNRLGAYTNGVTVLIWD